MKFIKSIIDSIRNFFILEDEDDEDEGEIIESEVKHDSETCNFKNCNEKLTIINGFKCHYCGHYHCDKHRLPENHKCKSGFVNNRGWDNYASIQREKN